MSKATAVGLGIKVDRYGVLPKLQGEMGIYQIVKNNRWFDSAMPITFILTFSVATGNHVMDVVHGGLFPYATWYGAHASLTNPIKII